VKDEWQHVENKRKTMRLAVSLLFLKPVFHSRISLTPAKNFHKLYHHFCLSSYNFQHLCEFSLTTRKEIALKLSVAKFFISGEIRERQMDFIKGVKTSKFIVVLYN
jgi:hypothetical protein